MNEGRKGNNNEGWRTERSVAEGHVPLDSYTSRQNNNHTLTHLQSSSNGYLTTQPDVPPPTYNYQSNSHAPQSSYQSNSNTSPSKYQSNSNTSPSSTSHHPNPYSAPASYRYPPPPSSSYPPPPSSSSSSSSSSSYPAQSMHAYPPPPTSSYPPQQQQLSGSNYFPPPTTSNTYVISPSQAGSRSSDARTSSSGGGMPPFSTSMMSNAAPTSKYPSTGPPSSPTTHNKTNQHMQTAAALNSPSRGPNKSSSSSSNSSNARIDPAQMPRPDKAQHGLVYHTRSATTRKTPPTSNSIYSAVDNGNCSPRVMRCTMVAPPGSKEILTQVGLPFTALCTPFAAPEHGEQRVPEVDWGELQLPPRCSRCAAYVNLNVQWIDGGDSWVCNICDMKNATPQWYYAPLDASGQRVDRSHRPELQVGSVQFLVNEDYCVRDIQKPIFVFAVDISQKAVTNGVTIAAIRAISSCITRLRQMDDELFQAAELEQRKAGADEYGGAAFKPPGAGGGFSIANLFASKTATTSSSSKPPIFKGRNQGSCKTTYHRIRAGIITFNHEVQFYSVHLPSSRASSSSSSSDPIQIHVCGGGVDPFAPLPPDQWLYPVTASSPDEQCPLDVLLQRLPELIASMSLSMPSFHYPHQQTPDNGYAAAAEVSSRSPRGESPCCPTAAVKAAIDGLQRSGGRLTVIASSHSNSGYGALPKMREKVSMYGAKEEINLYGYSSAILSRNSSSVLGDSTAAAIASAASVVSSTSSSSSSSSQKQVIAVEEYRSSCLEYKAIADECVQSMVCLTVVSCLGDDHLDGGAFHDTALLGDAVLMTGGRQHFVTGAMIREENVYRLEQQLLCDIDQAAASEAVVKLRTSIGIRVDSILGPGVYCPVKNESELCGIDQHSTFLFTLSHDSSLKEDDKVHLQLAVLHTTLNGRRKVRVHNLTMIVSNKHNIVFRNSDIEAVVVSLMKVAVDKALMYPLTEEVKGARAFLDSAVTNALHKYRVHCSPNSSKAQLILPESLKVLPVYTLGMLKHPALLVNTSSSSAVGSTLFNNNSTASTQSLQLSSNSYNGSTSRTTRPLALTPNNESALSRVAVRAHERAFELRRLLSSSVVEVINSLYPRVYSLFRLVDSDEESTQSDAREGLRPSGDDADDGTEDSSREYRIATAAAAAADKRPQPRELSSTLIKLTDCTLSPSSEVFESDKMYLVDDRSALYLFVGRNVPKVIVEVFLLDASSSSAAAAAVVGSSTALGSDSNSETASFALQNEMGRKFALFVDQLRASNPHKQELRIIWSDLSSTKPLNNRFSMRLIEDSSAGLMSYVDYLCNMHTRIQGLI